MKSTHKLSVAVPKRKQFCFRVSLTYRPVNKPTSGFQLYSSLSFWILRQRQISSKNFSPVAADGKHYTHGWVLKCNLFFDTFIFCKQKVCKWFLMSLSDFRFKGESSYFAQTDVSKPLAGWFWICGFVMFSTLAYSVLWLYDEVLHAWICKTFDVKLTTNYPRKLLRRKSTSGGLIRFTCIWMRQLWLYIKEKNMWSYCTPLKIWIKLNNKINQI